MQEELTLEEIFKECKDADGYLLFITTLKDKELKHIYLKHSFFSQDLLKVVEELKKHIHLDLEGR